MSVNSADLAVHTYLNELGILPAITHLGSETNDDNWQHDSWLVSFPKKGSNRNIPFEFNTGLGHRVKAKQFCKLPKLTEDEKAIGVTRIDNTQIYSYTRSDTFYSLAVTPTAASVLYCLLMDSQCGEECFESFCDEFGYDTDSRKALETYLECQAIGAKLQRVFTYNELNILRELLGDY